MSPGRRSLFSLPLLKQEGHDVDVQSERGGKGDLLEGQVLPAGVSDDERLALAGIGNKTGDGCFAVHHDERMSSPHVAQVPAQVCFEVRDPDVLHDHKIVIIGHDVKPNAESLASDRFTVASQQQTDLIGFS